MYSTTHLALLALDGLATVRGSSRHQEAAIRGPTDNSSFCPSSGTVLTDGTNTLAWQESLLLATVDRELAQLALNHQTEVNDLRKT